MSEDEETKLPPKMNLPKAGMPKPGLPKATGTGPSTPQPAKKFEKPASTTMHIDLDDDDDDAAPATPSRSPAEVISQVKDASTTMQIDLDADDTLDDLKEKAKAQGIGSKGPASLSSAPRTMKLPKPGGAPSVSGSAPTRVAKAPGAGPSAIKPAGPGTVKLKPASATKDSGDATNHLNLPSPSSGPGAPKTMKITPAAKSPAGPGTVKAKPVQPMASEGSTMQIDLTSDLPAPKASEAPTLVKKPGAGPIGAPRTIKIQPSAAGAKSKSETSRISLEAAKAESGKLGTQAAPIGNLTGGPKTIKIKPKSPSSVSKVPASEAATVKKKSETSRISLEDALASDKESGGKGAPNTIRLKRPSEASTIKVQRPKKMTTAGASDSEDAEEDSGENQTRRKTIKLKRPGESSTGGKKKLSLARPQGGDEEDDDEAPGPLQFNDEPEVEEVVDQPGWVFLVLSIFILGLAGTIAYCMAVQEFPEKNLSWFQQFTADPMVKVPFN
jgi:hypothetical protein